MNECYNPEMEKHIQKLMMKKDDIVKKLNRLRRMRR
jgi:hypothetical protein